MKEKKWYVIGEADHLYNLVHQILFQYPDSAVTLVCDGAGESVLSLTQEFRDAVKSLRYDPFDLKKSDFVVFVDDEVISLDIVKADAKKFGIPVFTTGYSYENGYQFYNLVSKETFDLHILSGDDDIRRSALIGSKVEKIIPAELDKIQIRPKAKRNPFFSFISFLPKNYQTNRTRKLVFDLSALFFAVFLGYAFSSFVNVDEAVGFFSGIPKIFYIMLLVGFFAQLVDGAVGLGYGITCSTIMMMLGVKLPAISGSIHTAEMFSSGISGYSHYKFGNVNKKLFWSLVIPGVIGAVTGSLLLVYFGNKYERITFAVLATYLMIIGVRLIIVASRKKIRKEKVKNIGLLGFSGGFLDAFGGGGWGPVVTSTLLSKGKKSNFVVGTVSLVEFFVTMSASLTFFVSLGISHGYIVAGLIIGGGIAAPIAAKLAGVIPQRAAILAVAVLVIISCIRLLVKVV